MAFEVRDLMVDVFAGSKELPDDRCKWPSECVDLTTRGRCREDTIIECTQVTKGNEPCPDDSVEPAEPEKDARRLAPLAVLREQLQLALRS
jgi:hypothetical protein